MSGYKAHFRFTWKMLIYLALSLALSLAVLYFYAARPLTDNYAHALLVLKIARDEYVFYAAQMCAYLYALVVCLVFIASLFASHRISGPVYRMARSADAAAMGDFSGRVRIRKNDHLKETVSDMDKTLALLRERLSEIKSASEKMKAISGGIEAAAASPSVDESVLAELVRKLEEGHGELKDRLSFFRI